MLVRATTSLQALVSVPLLDAKLKIRASGLMLGFMQTSSVSSETATASATLAVAPKSSKFVLRFTARADLLTFVTALRDAGARVNGDAPAQKAEPVDVKPALDHSSSQLFVSSQLSQSASGTVVAAGNLAVAAASHSVVSAGKRKAASDELALPTPAFARMSSMSSSYHQHSSQSTQTAARRERDENAPSNQFAAPPPPLTLLQRVAAVMAAPDVEAQVASVERALSILRQSSV
jgi:hypothetical protein